MVTDMNKGAFVVCSLIASNANALYIWGPDGASDVQQTANGYVISSLSGKGITVIDKTSNGYTVLSPRGVTSIEMSPEERGEVVIPTGDPAIPSLEVSH